MIIPGHVDMWLDKCRQNIQKLQKGELPLEEFRQQYTILQTITKVSEGRAYFHGTQYVFPKKESDATNAPV